MSISEFTSDLWPFLRFRKHKHRKYFFLSWDARWIRKGKKKISNIQKIRRISQVLMKENGPPIVN